MPINHAVWTTNQSAVAAYAASCHVSRPKNDVPTTASGGAALIASFAISCLFMAKTRVSGYSFGMEVFLGKALAPLAMAIVFVPLFATARYLINRFGSERVKKILLRKLWDIS